MRQGGFADSCFFCYLAIKACGSSKTCFSCNIDQFTCARNNYILQFTGCGKYNGRYMCLQCLEKRINLPPNDNCIISNR